MPWCTLMTWLKCSWSTYHDEIAGCGTKRCDNCTSSYGMGHLVFRCLCKRLWGLLQLKGSCFLRWHIKMHLHTYPVPIRKVNFQDSEQEKKVSNLFSLSKVAFFSLKAFLILKSMCEATFLLLRKITCHSHWVTPHKPVSNLHLGYHGYFQARLNVGCYSRCWWNKILV